jgi:hypothetical protein
MRQLCPILVMVAGLGGFVSAGTASAQTSSDPFERYLNSVDTKNRESSLRRFATECGINTEQVKAKYAVNVGGGWQIVGNLRKGLRSLDTDFYTVVEVWKSGDHVLTEMWPNSDDVGSEARVLSCFIRRARQSTEAIQWNVPLVKTDLKTWGYFQRWQRDADGKLLRTHANFVDEYERVIAKPKLDDDAEKSLKWIPPLGPLSEQKFPDLLLQ